MTSTPDLNYRRRTVPVRGGDLTVGSWGPEDGPVVLAVHGITASHLAWPLVASFLPGVHLIAPDLRGRGRSNELPGPWGMPQHAEDLAAVIEAFGVKPVVVLGHSMGAFASLVLANRYPDAVSRLVLIDGGLPLPTPTGLNDEEATRAILGPAAERLAMTFESRESYREFWRHLPAFENDWSQVIEDYLDYDLVGSAPKLRPSSSYEAVAADSIEIRGGTSVATALGELAHPTTLMTAPRGLMNEIPPLYPAEAIAKWTAKLPGLRTINADSVNHYTIVMAEVGARSVAALVSEALGASRIGTEHNEEVERA